MYYDQGADIETFQLTPSRRATITDPKEYLQTIISTHALTEGDLTSHKVDIPPIFQLTPSRRATWKPLIRHILNYFNSRPHGGRRQI